AGLHHGALGHDGLQAHLVRAGLLRIRGGGDLDELAGPQLARGRHGHDEFPLRGLGLDGRIGRLGAAGHEPGARGAENHQDGCDDEPPLTEEAHEISSWSRGWPNSLWTTELPIWLYLIIPNEQRAGTFAVPTE